MKKWICSLFVLMFFLPAGVSLAVHNEGPGLVQAPLLTQNLERVGSVSVWNTGDKFQLRVNGADSWEIRNTQIYVGNRPVPASRRGNLIPGRFNYKRSAVYEDGAFRLTLDLEDDLNFRWGEPYSDLRVQNIAVHVSAVKLGPTGDPISAGSAWAYTGLGADIEYGDIDEATLDDLEFEGVGKGWWFSYMLSHPSRGHFIDSPVEGLTFQTPTHSNLTDESGAFDYFPEETVTLSIGDYVLGSTVAAKKISPLDMFEMADTTNTEVGNMARLLQSLDSDADPDKGISITPDVVEYLEQAMDNLGYDSFDFADTDQIDAIITETIALATAAEPPLYLNDVDVEDALAHLDKSLDSLMFRKNVSKTPLLGSSKSKLNVMGVWFPALKANAAITYGEDYPENAENYSDPEPVTIEYYDEEGNFIRDTDEAKPLIVVYTDADEETDAHDIWAAVSRDDGNTWKRKNLSRMADRSSFELANGEEFYGHSKKPVFQVKGNKMLIAWTSKFARGGKPRYAIKTCDDPATPEIETPETGCAVYCTGKVEDGTESCEPDYPYDDPYYADDIWGVSGHQRSVDYTDEGYPEVGEVPYSAVWVARGIIATAADVSKGVGRFEGDIVWFKPERLTSGRRDANQVFMGAADGAGFGISWQEDPGGLRPGEAKGPGPGWGGATTNHKTDIWYSFITWADFAKVDENFVSGGDPEHDDEDFAGRPKALVPMSLPVRISDNDVVNTENMWVQLGTDGLPELDADGNFIPIYNDETSSDQLSDGSHRYGYMLDGFWNWNGNLYTEDDTINGTIGWTQGDGGVLYQFTNQKGELKTVVVTADGRALDGNTGAARPNLFMQTYTKQGDDPTTDKVETEYKSAWAIMAYEESKGVGLGPDEDAGSSDGEGMQDGSGYDPYEEFPDSGKNAIYHSFDFRNPDLVSAGTILNLPEMDGELIGEGEPLYVAEPTYLGSTDNGDGTYNPILNPDAGELLTDWKGDPILAYENARRPRFILQSKSAAFGGVNGDGSFQEPNNSGTVLIVLYKEGEEGAGRPSDIMARRCVVGATQKGNPWAPGNFLPGAQNVSTVTPVVTWVNPDRDENAKGEGTKVCSWTQPEENLLMKSGVNPYEDARAHRGAIRGDFVAMGYSYTPNWAASRNAHDKYDFYIRRSFNGGETWTTDPDADVAVDHTDIFINPEGISGSEVGEDGSASTDATKHYEVITSYDGGGVYEPARNVSLLKNNKTSVIEPRLVGVPGTIKKDGVWTGIAEDKQNTNVFYLAYGTSTNLKDVEKAPEDLFYSFSMDKGTTLAEDTFEVSSDSSGNYAGQTVTRWAWLAKGDSEQGEVQLRMTPDGSRFYSSWIQEIEPADPENPGHFEGSDIWFRRITPIEFPSNDARPVEP